MEVTKPHKFIGFGAMEVIKPYKFTERSRKAPTGNPKVCLPETILGRIYGRILDFRFGGRREGRYEMTFDLDSGTNFSYIFIKFS